MASYEDRFASSIAKFYLSSTQGAGAAGSNVQWDATEFNEGGGFTLGANGVITVNFTGYFNVIAQAYQDGASWGPDSGISFTRPSSLTDQTNSFIFGDSRGSGSTASLSGLVKCTAGDTFTVNCGPAYNGIWEGDGGKFTYIYLARVAN